MRRKGAWATRVARMAVIGDGRLELLLLLPEKSKSTTQTFLFPGILSLNCPKQYFPHEIVSHLYEAGSRPSGETRVPLWSPAALTPPGALGVSGARSSPPGASGRRGPPAAVAGITGVSCILAPPDSRLATSSPVTRALASLSSPLASGPCARPA